MRLGLLLPFVVTVLQAAELYSVSGVVVDSDTRVPMKGVRVSLNDTSGPQQNKAVTTGADGTFALAVPQGMYRLAAEDSSWGQYFGARVNGGVGVVTGPDQTTTDIVFPWYAPSSISGPPACGQPSPGLGGGWLTPGRDSLRLGLP